MKEACRKECRLCNRGKGRPRWVLGWLNWKSFKRARLVLRGLLRRKDNDAM